MGILAARAIETASAPPGHPARGRLCCRGRSPGSRVSALVRPSQENPSGMMDQSSPLTVAGAAPVLSEDAPASLLAPGLNCPGEPRQPTYGPVYGGRQPTTAILGRVRILAVPIELHPDRYGLTALIPAVLIGVAQRID